MTFPTFGNYDDFDFVSVLLLLLMNFVSGFKLELMYMSRIVSIRSSLTHFHGFQLLVLVPEFIEITFFCLYQHNKSFESKVKFRQDSNCCKRILKAAKLAYASRTKECTTSQKHGSWDFWRIASSVLNKVESAAPPLFNGPEVLCSASDQAEIFAEIFSKNSNLDDSGIYSPVLPSRTNLKLHNISVTLKMVKKVKQTMIFQGIWS